MQHHPAAPMILQGTSTVAQHNQDGSGAQAVSEGAISFYQIAVIASQAIRLCFYVFRGLK